MHRQINLQQDTFKVLQDLEAPDTAVTLFFEKVTKGELAAMVPQHRVGPSSRSMYLEYFLVGMTVNLNSIV